MKKALVFLGKLLGKLALVALILFAATFTMYMTNAENQLSDVNRKLSTEWDEDGNVVPVERS